MDTHRSAGEGVFGASAGIGKQAIETDVIVYEHLEKENITTEIITAKTAQGMYQYLKKKGLIIEQGSIPVLGHYIGKKFAFIVSWISQTNVVTTESQSKQKGVFVTFFTQKIYYPLLLTSVYGNEIVPTSIRIFGHRSPKIFNDIKNYTKVEYFVDNYVRLGEGLEDFYNSPTKNVKYTKIEIKAPSKFLTDDLWISSGAPLKTYYSSFVAQHSLASGILLLILSSIITCIMAGWIIFKKLRNKNGILKLALVGLSNCLSITGLAITTVLFRTKAKNENVASLLNEIKQKGYIWKRKLTVILFFATLPFLTLGAVALPILIRQTGFHIRDMMPIIIVYIISLLVLIFALFIKKIKAEDKSLFIQLKSYDYSSWSFNPKDKMKFIFVPLFSFSFLAISWLIIKLVEFTV